MNNIKLSWVSFTLALIPLCFIVEYIVDSENHRNVTVFMLVLVSYSMPFFYRRTQIPTSISLITFYIISIVGAFIILFNGAGWAILVVIILTFVYPATTITTKYGKDIYEKIDKEEKEKKGIAKLFATSSQREINMSNIFDTFIFIVVAILFLLLKEHFVERYKMINKSQKTEIKMNFTGEKK